MQDQKTIVLILFLNSMNYFKHFKAHTRVNNFYYFSNDMQKNISHNLFLKIKFKFYLNVNKVLRIELWEYI
jgi:hypothetical protein